MVMDPRIKSIEDHKKGIPNSDQWNHTQPPSKADTKRFWYLNLFIYLTSWTLITYNYFVFKDKTPYKQMNDLAYQYMLPKSIGEMDWNDMISQEMINILPKVVVFFTSGLPYNIYYHIK